MQKHNSTIRQKHCNCSPDCTLWPTIGCGGKNIKHISEEEKHAKFEKYRRSTLSKRKKAVTSSLSRKLHSVKSDVDKEFRERVELFFQNAAKIIAQHPYCHECELIGIKTFIPEKYYRHASAHCLPKRKEYGFPSIADNVENLLVLATTCGHHYRYDSSWTTASQMKIWPIALEKIKKMLPFIAASEMKNLPEFISKTIENDSSAHTRIE